MRRIRQLLNSRYTVWTMFALPGVWMMQGYWRGTAFYGELMHATGDLAAELLILALLITPLRMLLPRYAWPLWLLQRRRYIGVAAFAYAALHALLYAERLGTFAAVWAQAAELDLLAGWLGLAIMLPLALTSNNVSMRKLGRGWKRLHRSVHAAAALTLAHWYLAAFDPTMGIVYFAGLTFVALFAQLRRYRERQRLTSPG